LVVVTAEQSVLYWVDKMVVSQVESMARMTVYLKVAVKETLKVDLMAEV